MGGVFMKKALLILFSVFALVTVLICFAGCGFAKEKAGGFDAPDTSCENELNSDVTNELSKKGGAELRGVWLSCYEIETLCASGSEKKYREEVETVLEKLCENKINTVFFQARAFCDALYYSEIFPDSVYVSGSAGKKAPFDSLKIFIEIADKYGVAVHAWVNPFRVSYNGDINALPKDSPAVGLAGYDGALIICSEGIYLNPADSRCRRLILDGIRELVSGYGISGIHFDDYFYPDCEFDDTLLYKKYKKEGGTLSVADWRRANVSDFISSVYSLVKEQNAHLVFGISPEASVERCRERLFADVEKWCGCEGYIDYIMPQLYFGFENENAPFCRLALEWSQTVNADCVELMCGLAVYKCGRTDKNAGSGAREWAVNSDILARQYDFLKKNGVYSGFCLFSYSFAFGKNVNDNSDTELKMLSDMLK